jgi:alpha-glucuronidase
MTRGPGSSVARVVDGSLDGRSVSAMSAVANIGNDRNWCGHPFAQANWYAYGRFAWDHGLTSAAVAEEWLRQTFGNDEALVAGCREVMLASREAVVDYMTPLGLHHLMAWDHHYGPGPWIATGRADWTSVYFHRADAAGLGFDRTPSGSNAVSQYAPELRARFGSRAGCPDELLLWFHHVSWRERLRSGRTLWEELCHRYQAGVEAVRRFQATWERLADRVDSARATHVRALLAIQEREARWWRDACLAYFRTFAQEPLPAGVEPPEKTLEEYQGIVHRYVPGNPSTI